MSYFLHYSDEIIEKKSKTIPLIDLDRAKELLKELKDAARFHGLHRSGERHSYALRSNGR